MINFEISWIFIILIGISGAALLIGWVWQKINYSWLDNICTLLVISFPFQGFPSLIGSLGNLRISQIIVVLGLFFTLILLLKKDAQLLTTKIHPVFVWMLVFILASLPGWLVVQDFGKFIQYLLGILFVFGATFLLTHFAKNIWEKAQYLILAMLFACLFATYQFVTDMVGLTDYSFLRPQYTKEIFGIPRVHSFFLEPLLFAGGLFAPVIITIFALISRQSIITLPKNIITWLKSVKLSFVTQSYTLHLVTLVIFISFFALTYSKSAFLALAIVIIPIIILTIWKYKDIVTIKLLSFLSLLGVAGLTVLVLTSTTFQDAILEISINFYQSILGNGTSASERNTFLETAQNFLPQYYITGAGPGQYGSIVGFALRYLNGESRNLIINNIYLEIWFEYGLLALILFITLWIIVFSQNLKFIVRTPDWRSKKTLLQLSLGLSLVAYLIQWWFFSPIYIMPIFILLGLLLAVNKKEAILA